MDIQQLIKKGLQQEGLNPFVSTLSAAKGAHYGELSKSEKSFLEALCSMLNSYGHKVRYKTANIGFLSFVPGIEVKRHRKVKEDVLSIFFEDDAVGITQTVIDKVAGAFAEGGDIEVPVTLDFKASQAKTMIQPILNLIRKLPAEILKDAPYLLGKWDIHAYKHTLVISVDNIPQPQAEEQGEAQPA